MTPMNKPILFIVLLFITANCGGNPYLDTSLRAAELEGKTQDWFIEQWGAPHATSARFFWGETWTYVRIAGGNSILPFTTIRPTSVTSNSSLMKRVTSKTTTTRIADEEYVHCVPLNQHNKAGCTFHWGHSFTRNKVTSWSVILKSAQNETKSIPTHRMVSGHQL